MDDRDDELQSAHRSAQNSTILTVITVLFGIVWLAEGGRLPTWLVSGWFLLVIPLTLYLMFMYRRRYRALLTHHEEKPAHPDH
jgi:Ca2+/Na+ antiporter